MPYSLFQDLWNAEGGWVHFLFDARALQTDKKHIDTNAQNKIITNAIDEIKNKINRVSSWLTGSGLKINDQKTEICIFHRKEKLSLTIIINNNEIRTTNHMTILGIIFDSNLAWDLQYNHSIREANHNLTSPLRSLPKHVLLYYLKH